MMRSREEAAVPKWRIIASGISDYYEPIVSVQSKWSLDSADLGYREKEFTFSSPILVILKPSNKHQVFTRQQHNSGMIEDKGEQMFIFRRHWAAYQFRRTLPAGQKCQKNIDTGHWTRDFISKQKNPTQRFSKNDRTVGPVSVTPQPIGFSRRGSFFYRYNYAKLWYLLDPPLSVLVVEGPRLLKYTINHLHAHGRNNAHIPSSPINHRIMTHHPS